MIVWPKFVTPTNISSAQIMNSRSSVWTPGFNFCISTIIDGCLAKVSCKIIQVAFQSKPNSADTHRIDISKPSLILDAKNDCLANIRNLDQHFQHTINELTTLYMDIRLQFLVQHNLIKM